MLVKDCGLTVSEFTDWLTISTAEKDYVELFDGSRVAPENLTSSDVLSLSGQFAVPNVMYMAWFGEGMGVGKSLMNWSANISNLNSLDFSVRQFNNDLYSSTENERARNDFLGGIQTFSGNNELHGLYMMGHSNGATIGSEGSITNFNGPEWSVHYKGVVSIESSLNYRLRALMIHACYSDNTNSRYLVTPENEGGIFWASPMCITHLSTTLNLLPKTGERNFMKLFLFLSIRPFIRTELAVNKGLKLSLSHTNICL